MQRMLIFQNGCLLENPRMKLYGSFEPTSSKISTTGLRMTFAASAWLSNLEPIDKLQQFLFQRPNTLPNKKRPICPRKVTGWQIRKKPEQKSKVDETEHGEEGFETGTWTNQGGVRCAIWRNRDWWISTEWRGLQYWGRCDWFCLSMDLWIHFAFGLLS